MKKFILFMALTCWLQVHAQFPVANPEAGDGRLLICGQNLENYFVENLESTRPKYHDEVGLEDKTNRIVRVFRHLDADIYALCELENSSLSLPYLSNAMNVAAGSALYGYVDGGYDSYGDVVMSGFIYRTDKVKPYGPNTAGASQQLYRPRMRVQAFEELQSGERFVLSMNHFKAMDSTDDAGESKRQHNAEELISNLNYVDSDPDMLIMGDLNCFQEDAPLQYIQSAGYDEVLLYFNSNAYSYYFNGTNQLIDHVYANESMAAQIAGSDVFHINTGTPWNGDYYYSDHDPYLVSVNLFSERGPEYEPMEFIQDFKTGLGDFTVYTPQGAVSWNSNASYGAIASGYQKPGPMETWLISPAIDLSRARSASLSFRHNIYHDNSNGQYADMQTLWISSDFDEDNPGGASWYQLDIPQYGVKRWTTCEVELPAEEFSSNFRYAFKYTASDGDVANYWEIDNSALNYMAEVTGIDRTPLPDTSQEVRKVVKNGQIYVIVGHKVYNLQGVEIKNLTLQLCY